MTKKALLSLGTSLVLGTCSVFLVSCGGDEPEQNNEQKETVRGGQQGTGENPDGTGDGTTTVPDPSELQNVPNVPDPAEIGQ